MGNTTWLSQFAAAATAYLLNLAGGRMPIIGTPKNAALKPIAAVDFVMIAECIRLKLRS